MANIFRKKDHKDSDSKNSSKNKNKKKTLKSNFKQPGSKKCNEPKRVRFHLVPTVVKIPSQTCREDVSHYRRLRLSDRYPFELDEKYSAFNEIDVFETFITLNMLMGEFGKKTICHEHLEKFWKLCTVPNNEIAKKLIKDIYISRDLFKYFGREGLSDPKIREGDSRKIASFAMFSSPEPSRTAFEIINKAHTDFLSFIPAKFSLTEENVTFFRELEWFVECLFDNEASSEGERQLWRKIVTLPISLELKGRLLSMREDHFKLTVFCKNLCSSTVVSAIHELVSYDLDFKNLLFEEVLPHQFIKQFRMEYVGDLKFGIVDILGKMEDFSNQKLGNPETAPKYKPRASRNFNMKSIRNMGDEEEEELANNYWPELSKL
ncbi:uncharacterized protein SAPINGB_P000896 [Magnusiomyces paraingens]|uniref:Uncharacterized protein n=1 Tax=Magnusiomyces paraingens TaxID=2606893 RepID=A0A5E8B946_9ASCO|nr:uncharacterized protein SAPINGB_P000896 [Saprochaete ingens]VVT45798.1 unnamed protein product [Saprochaete ingens]